MNPISQGDHFKPLEGGGIAWQSGTCQKTTHMEHAVLSSKLRPWGVTGCQLGETVNPVGTGSHLILDFCWCALFC